MNFLSNSSFLCLDIGTYTVRGFASCISDAKIVQSATYSVESTDTVFAVKTVVDELSSQLRTHFDSAYITGNFGKSVFEMNTQKTFFKTEKKITEQDIIDQITRIKITDGFNAVHVIPMHYETTSVHNLLNPIGYIDTKLESIFGVISYENTKKVHLLEILKQAYIQPIAFYDSAFIQNAIYRKEKEIVLFIDLGANHTGVSIWTDRGPIFFKNFEEGQDNITKELSSELHITISYADKLKREVSDMISAERDRFIPADIDSGFSREDVNEIFLPKMKEILGNIYTETENIINKHKPKKIILSGGGSAIPNLPEYIEQIFNIPVDNVQDNASTNALNEYVWNSFLPERTKYENNIKKWDKYIQKITKLFHRKKRVKRKFIPILPSTLAFDMNNSTTYSMFAASNISMIHVDIMDGLFVDNITTDTSQIKQIRKFTNAHLHVHLMTESPSIWASDAIEAGADTIIVSMGTQGISEALQIIRNAGKRCGVALNPSDSIETLKPYIKNIDEVMLMAVTPGASGQEFIQNTIHKISILNKTRKTYGLKFLISVDGGINPENAKLCWDAGANLLITGSFLSSATDKPLAIQQLLKH